ncbi:hypothetical protein MHK_009385, partial [Candidatus Magnetomorum sp. HK-1]
TFGSSDITLIPVENISYTCSADIFYLSMTPASNQSGNTTITITITDAGNLTATESFNVTVNEINDTPALTSIDPQITDEDTAINSLSFTVTDIETAGCSHGITFASSDIELIPVENISYTCSAGIFYLSMTPVSNQSGHATLTITISDAGNLTATESFEITVSEINDPPTMTSIDSQTIDEDTVIEALEFTVTDIETAGCSHGISFASSDIGLIPVENISYTCSADIFYLSITPVSNQSGHASLTITITDAGNLTATESFEMTVNEINDPPAMTPINPQTIDEDTVIEALEFTVTDNETAGCSHGITFDSSDIGLIPVENISYTCSADIFYLSITPVSNQSGHASLTITITDAGNLTATESFEITVNEINDPPTMTSINPQTIDEDTVIEALELTVTDIETAGCSHGISFASSDTGLIPVENISYTCSAGIFYLSMTPVSNQSGHASLTITITDAGNLTATESFEMTVNEINDPPAITSIDSQTIDEDTVIEALEFTVTDNETAGCSHGISFASSDTGLIPVENISYTCSAGIFYLSMTPVSNQSGHASLTITISDAGNLTATESFEMTVNEINDPPTMTSIAPQTTNEETEINSISFTANDIEDAPCSLEITITSSNQTLFPDANLSYTCNENNYTLTANPSLNQSGAAVITITVTDSEGLTAMTAFNLTVTSINDAPTLSTISNQSTTEDNATGAINFTVSDAEGDNLTVSANSSNLSLVSIENIAISGTGLSKTLMITPTANEFGVVTITIAVTDGGLTTTSAFELSITAVNDVPIISGINTQLTQEDTAIHGISFTVSDIDNDDNTLIVTGESSNISLVTMSNITFDGTGSNRTIAITPVANENGAISITVSVSDSDLTATTSFTLTIEAVNDSPVNTVMPTISGVYHFGQTLTINDGSWNDDIDKVPGTLTYSYQWQRADDAMGTNTTHIDTSQAYTLTLADNAKY